MTIARSFFLACFSYQASLIVLLKYPKVRNAVQSFLTVIFSKAVYWCHCKHDRLVETLSSVKER